MSNSFKNSISNTSQESLAHSKKLGDETKRLGVEAADQKLFYQAQANALANLKDRHSLLKSANDMAGQ